MCQIQFLRPWKSVKNGVNTEFLPLRKRKKSLLHWKSKVCENCTINFVVLTKDNFTSFRKSVKAFCIAHFFGNKKADGIRWKCSHIQLIIPEKEKLPIIGSLFLCVLFFLIFLFEFLEKIHKKLIA